MDGPSVRRLVADHPIAAFLVVGNAVAWAFAVSPVADKEIWLERPLYASLGTIFGVGLAAFLVTAVADGRAAVADLLRRTFRWRVPARWHLIALLGVPAATTVIAASFYGPTPSTRQRAAGPICSAFSSRRSSSSWFSSSSRRRSAGRGSSRSGCTTATAR